MYQYMVYIVRCIYFVGVNVLGDIARQSIIKPLLLQKDHQVDVHVFTIDELRPLENRSLAINRTTDTGLLLELFCGLHGNILNKLPDNYHLVSPIVMVKSAVKRPLKMKVTILHALETSKMAKKPHDIKLFAINTAGEEPKSLQLEEYEFESNNRCVITTVICKQRMFALTVMRDFTHMHSKFNIVHRSPPTPAIRCTYCVLSDSTDDGISVKVYCAIDLPIVWKVSYNKIAHWIMGIRSV